jgi:hypothetical protein
MLKSTRVNLSNPWLKSWEEDNFIEIKQRQIIKSNSQSIKYWSMKLKKESQLEKKTWVNRVNSLNSRFGSWALDNFIKSKLKKILWNLNSQ